jgi:hypothetical protein
MLESLCLERLGDIAGRRLLKSDQFEGGLQQYGPMTLGRPCPSRSRRCCLWKRLQFVRATMP